MKSSLYLHLSGSADKPKRIIEPRSYHMSSKEVRQRQQQQADENTRIDLTSSITVLTISSGYSHAWPKTAIETRVEGNILELTKVQILHIPQKDCLSIELGWGRVSCASMSQDWTWHLVARRPTWRHFYRSLPALSKKVERGPWRVQQGTRVEFGGSHDGRLSATAAAAPP